MPVSIDLPDGNSDRIFSTVFNFLRSVDRQFSMYKRSSELRKYRTGEIGENETTSLFREIRALCEMYSKQTNGYFSAYYCGPYDPTGLVKGWAIQRAATLLKAEGMSTYMINIAGDICVSSSTDKVWTIGIQNPTSNQELIDVISLQNGGVATSGTYERGNHIFNPHTRLRTDELVSATVYGSDIMTADVFATACLAMESEQAVDFIEKQNGYEAFLVTSTNKKRSTSRFASKMQNAQQ